MKQVLLVVIFYFGLFSPLLANEKIVAVTENWKPFNFEVNGVVKGTSTEIVRAVLDRADIEYIISVFPWARSYNMARFQENILIYSLMRTPEREDLFKWVGPVSSSDSMVLYKLSTRKDIVLESLDHAKEYRIGINRDTPMHAYLINLGFDERSIDVVTVDQLGNIKKLLYGRIDLLPASEKQFRYAIQEAGFSEDTFEKALPLFKLSPYMALSRKTPDDLVEKVRKSYNSLVAEGRVERFE